MLIKRPEEIKSSEITDESFYLNRRTFIRGAALAATTLGTGYLYRTLTATSRQPQGSADLSSVDAELGGLRGGESLTSYEDITNYNNFYEFSTNKQAVARRAREFITRPWTVQVEGYVNKPKSYDIDELLKLIPVEERVYRLRCVEGWSMVIPWLGFSLARLISQVEPTSQAKYVHFITLYDPAQMPNQSTGVLGWPYVEGLRLDEAMHPLTLLATGLYGKTLPAQNGAPLRLVVPWKYGFKSIKSIVKIRFVESQPPTTWNLAAPDEYGFYSNVNPDVSHPRWSQARERRIGEFGLRDTLMFNGYGDQVAHLYDGMDLRRYY
jgi:sulfoxide reductase catalytic subunit YedY